IARLLIATFSTLICVGSTPGSGWQSSSSIFLMDSSTSTELTHFAEDVLRGLSSEPKQLSSRYFYDDEGSRLFMEIMKLPEYYLTRAELKIYSEQTDAIYEAFTDSAADLDHIQLAAGDGTKAAVLIEHFLDNGLDFTHSPTAIP